MTQRPSDPATHGGDPATSDDPVTPHRPSDPTTDRPTASQVSRQAGRQFGSQTETLPLTEKFWKKDRQRQRHTEEAHGHAVSRIWRKRSAIRRASRGQRKSAVLSTFGRLQQFGTSDGWGPGYLLPVLDRAPLIDGRRQTTGMHWRRLCMESCSISSHPT